ncbi:hypothetical protein CPB83DRAFT_759293 [Crepidotus variabilis]|uniref:Uncharacterized protein n=1 Tax=Crepidotus variabilis TaxID=179855 RepID=A0A9P6EQ18_9AGAR|nr:hypothetical protein CPB83DRAFT_759293 [Crepidotus variabilis]
MAQRSLFVSIARMHHISNPSKFRRLRRFADQDGISGLVKAGKPGILVFDGESQAINTFLEHARGLRYLDFHHVDTKLFSENINFNQNSRLNNGEAGLREVESMNEMICRLEVLGLKDWFRLQLGMKTGHR